MKIYFSNEDKFSLIYKGLGTVKIFLRSYNFFSNKLIYF